MTRPDTPRQRASLARTRRPAGLAGLIVAEASELGSIGDEIGLLRLWIRETAQENPRHLALMTAMSRQIVAAVAMKYRLDPKRTDDLAAAVAAVLQQIGSQLGLPATPEV